MPPLEQVFQVTIVCEDEQLTSDELTRQLGTWVNSGQIHLSKEAIRAAPDPTLASVIVVASAALLRDVIRGLVQIALARERRKFSVQKSDGTRKVELISEGSEIPDAVEKVFSALDSASVIRF